MSDKPVQEFRASGGIKATVWRNHSDRGEFFTTTFTRSYRDGSDEWRESTVFMPDQLPKLALVIGKAYEFIQMGRGRSTPANDNHVNDNDPSPQSEGGKAESLAETEGESFQEKVAQTRQGGRRR